MINSKSKSEQLFIIGVILLAIGTGISTFATYFIYFYGIPVIIALLGLTLVWISRTSMNAKVALTITPIILFLGYQYLWRMANTSEPETFLIPASYRGKVHIIFNEPCGQPIKYENGRRVYEIPMNGILMTEFKDEYGFIDHEYFLVDSTGKRLVLDKKDVRDFNEDWTVEKNPKEPSRDSLGVFHWGQTGNGEHHDEGRYYFQEFYVSSYRELSESFGFMYDKKFDSLEYNIIKTCRSQSR